MDTTKSLQSLSKKDIPLNQLTRTNDYGSSPDGVSFSSLAGLSKKLENNGMPELANLALPEVIGKVAMSSPAKIGTFAELYPDKGLFVVPSVFSMKGNKSQAGIAKAVQSAINRLVKIIGGQQRYEIAQIAKIIRNFRTFSIIDFWKFESRAGMLAYKRENQFPTQRGLSWEYLLDWLNQYDQEREKAREEVMSQSKALNSGSTGSVAELIQESEERRKSRRIKRNLAFDLWGKFLKDVLKVGNMKPGEDGKIDFEKTDTEKVWEYCCHVYAIDSVQGLSEMLSNKLRAKAKSLASGEITENVLYESSIMSVFRTLSRVNKSASMGVVLGSGNLEKVHSENLKKGKAEKEHVEKFNKMDFVRRAYIRLSEGIEKGKFPYHPDHFALRRCILYRKKIDGDFLGLDLITDSVGFEGVEIEKIKS